MSQNAALRIKEHFDKVANLWQSRQAKEWQARLHCEAIAMNIMGLKYDTNGAPPKNMYLVTTKVLEFVLSANSDAVLGSQKDDDRWGRWLTECRQDIAKVLEDHKDQIEFGFMADAAAPDQNAILEDMHNARRLDVEARYPVENPALINLVTDYQLSDSYQSAFKAISDAYLESLNKTPDLVQTMRDWSTMLYADQKEWLQKQVGVLAKIQSEKTGLDIYPTRVDWFVGMKSIGALDVDMKERTAQNDVIKMSGEVSNNLHASLSCALDCAVHEQYHQLHNTLARAARYDLIHEDHALYEDALYFDAQWQRDGYISFGEAYRNQPDERYAREFSNFIGMRMKEKQTQALSLNFMTAVVQGETISPNYQIPTASPQPSPPV